ncbi:hypothetical protein L9F63_027832, partial [Diploptera punctata]
ISEDISESNLLNKKTPKGDSYHSKGGNLKITRLKEIYDIDKTILKAAEEFGYQTLEDINSDKELGFFPLLMTATNGTRCSAAKAFLSPAKSRNNLHVAKNAHVTKILIDPHSKQAHGVEFQMKNGNASNKIR